MKTESPAGRSFLFLQGPISPFFAEVGAALRARGHAVRRVNLCLGDKLFWRGPGATDFQGRPEQWPGWIDRFIARHGVTDIVLLGEQRAYHRAAIAAARARSATISVTDFGYFRPDWITFEQEGMGGDSLFPSDPEAIQRLATAYPPADLTERMKDSFGLQAFWDVLYHLATTLPWPFAHYRSHQLHHPLLTYAGIGLRLARRKAEIAEGARALALASAHPFWVFAMQMETDFSIRAYSTYPDMDTPVSEAVRSFARNAPPEGRLVVKVHPLDPCLKRWSRRIPAIAEAAGVGSRVLVAHHGPMDDMICRSRGVITVNSTVGMKAVALERPVIALGRAVWNVPGLAFQGPLDRFWSEGVPPEPVLRAAFLGALQGATQLRGLFYARHGRRIAVENATAALAEGRVGVPAAVSPPMAASVV